MDKIPLKLQQELASCGMPHTLVAFLLNLLRCEPLSEEDVVKFTKQKSIPNTNSDKSKLGEIEGPVLVLKHEGTYRHALNNTASNLSPPGIDARYKEISPINLTIQQTHTECKFDELALNAFYKQVFPNIESEKKSVKSTLTILLPMKQAVSGQSNWDLFNITDAIFDDNISDDIKEVRRFRLAILLTLLKTVKGKNKSRSDDKLSTELIDRLLLPIHKVDDVFIALIKALTDKIVGTDEAKANTLLNFELKGKNSYKMNSLNVVTVSKTNNKNKDTKSETDAKDMAEVNRAEQGACWGLGFFLATLDGIAIKIELKKHNSYPVRNIIIAPKVITDTLKQVKPYRTNYLTGSIEYDEKENVFRHHKPYHSNKIPRIGSEPQLTRKPKTNIAKALLSEGDTNESLQDEGPWEKTEIPGVTKQVSRSRDTPAAESLIHFPIYLPPFRNSRTLKELISNLPQRHNSKVK